MTYQIIMTSSRTIHAKQGCNDYRQNHEQDKILFFSHIISPYTFRLLNQMKIPNIIRTIGSTITRRISDV